MNDKLSINVNIADRLYPLRIERNEEESIRKAAKLINERIAQYRQKYISKDLQDCLAMAALQFVIQKFDTDKRIDVSPLIEELEELNDFLTDFLEKETQEENLNRSA